MFASALNALPLIKMNVHANEALKSAGFIQLLQVQGLAA